MGILHEDVFTFMISDEKCFWQNFWRKSNILQVQALLPKSALYVIMRENMVQPERLQL